MPLCGCLFWLIIGLLFIAGIAYLIGADDLGELAVDIIRFIIVAALILILISLILVMVGYINWDELMSGIPFLKLLMK